MVTNPDEPSGVHGDSDRGKLYGHQPCPFHTQLPWKWSMIVWERKGGPNTIKQLSINIIQLSHVRYYNGSICGSAWALAGDELPMTVCTVSPSQPFQNNNRRQIQCTRCLRFTNHIICTRRTWMRRLGEETSYEFPKNMDLELQASWRININIDI